MDLVVTRPGGVTRYLLDVRTVDARAPAYPSADATVREATAEKLRRNRGQALAFPLEHRGRLGPAAVAALWLCSQEAAVLTGARPAALMRSWRRSLALVAAFEPAEVLRAPCTATEVNA